jgi:hypothetical protein
LTCDNSLAMLRCVPVASAHNIVRQDDASCVKLFLVLLEALEHIVCLHRYTAALLFKLLPAGQPTRSSVFCLSVIVVDDRDQDDKRKNAIADIPLQHFRLPLFLKPTVKPLYETYDALAQLIMHPTVKRLGPAMSPQKRTGTCGSADRACWTVSSLSGASRSSSWLRKNKMCDHSNQMYGVRLLDLGPCPNLERLGLLSSSYVSAPRSSRRRGYP